MSKNELRQCSVSFVREKDGLILSNEKSDPCFLLESLRPLCLQALVRYIYMFYPLYLQVCLRYVYRFVSAISAGLCPLFNFFSHSHFSFLILKLMRLSLGRLIASLNCLIKVLYICSDIAAPVYT